MPADPTRVTLSARSVIASTLLGTHPPELPGRLLVALVCRFGIAEGTARVALSRMVDRGELMNSGGVYGLRGALLQRQRRQDSSRFRTEVAWDGTWDQVVVLSGPTHSSHRSARRASLQALKLAELREGVWMRPANLDPSRLPDETAWVAEDILWASTRPAIDPCELGAQLWDLSAWADECAEFSGALREMSTWLADDDAVALAPGFEVAAAVLRHLVADPELPAALLPAGWPGDGLRREYDAFDANYRAALRRFFAAHR